MDLQLRDRVVMVTGGGGRLGRVICSAFGEEGARVAVCDVDGERARAVADQIRAQGADAVAVAGDVSAEADVERMVRDVTEALGPVDVLVNCHGFVPNQLLVEYDVETWDRVFAINTRGTMLTCRAVARQLLSRGVPGAIVNISSGAGSSARAGGSAYCGSKAAVNLLTHTLAIELGPYGIRVNAVAPGLILDEVITPGMSHPSAYVNMMLEATPMRRTGSPRDVADAVLFLASPRNSWITGAILEVTGGSHCGRPHVPLPRDLR